MSFEILWVYEYGIEFQIVIQRWIIKLQNIKHIVKFLTGFIQFHTHLPVCRLQFCANIAFQ